MKKMTYLFLLAATLGACSPKPENKIELRFRLNGYDDTQ
mgnify:CR=1 FL=1